MKQILITFCLLTMISLFSGCISRTVSTGPENRGSKIQNKAYGADQQRIVGEKKLIWIWQDEYRNPK